MNIKKIRCGIFFIVWMGITLASLFYVKNKLSYIEFQTMNDAGDLYIELAGKEDEIVQEFYMPYDILYGISIKIGTFMRDNNSQWRIVIKHIDTKNVVYDSQFHASLIPDNSFYLLKADKNIRLQKGQGYDILPVLIWDLMKKIVIFSEI